jgi:hypothetical protein
MKFAVAKLTSAFIVNSLRACARSVSGLWARFAMVDERCDSQQQCS